MAPSIKGLFIPCDYPSNLQTAINECQVTLTPDANGHYRREIVRLLRCRIFRSLSFGLSDLRSEAEFVLWDEEFGDSGKGVNLLMLRVFGVEIGGPILILGGTQHQSNKLVYDFTTSGLITLSHLVNHTPPLIPTFITAARKGLKINRDRAMLAQQQGAAIREGAGGTAFQMSAWKEAAYEWYLLHGGFVKVASPQRTPPTIHYPIVQCPSCHTFDKQLYACSGCHVNRYCSKECQKADWANHKGFCVSEAAKGVGKFVGEFKLAV
ncbi:hypothetical protein HDV00_007122 [Rhizophlyctis rosea]|nr:hypothetical protein HDV00_007122 [Rhizophlyctis rosea]